jgi:hypothetical protein
MLVPKPTSMSNSFFSLAPNGIEVFALLG